MRDLMALISRAKGAVTKLATALAVTKSWPRSATMTCFEVVEKRRLLVSVLCPRLGPGWAVDVLTNSADAPVLNELRGEGPLSRNRHDRAFKMGQEAHAADRLA
jgi:hypothetical protein